MNRGIELRGTASQPVAESADRRTLVRIRQGGKVRLACILCLGPGLEMRRTVISVNDFSFKVYTHCNQSEDHIDVTPYLWPVAPSQ